MLHAAYDGDVAGHFAGRKTTLKIKRHFFWPGLTEDACHFCRSCRVCQKRKPPPTQPHHPLQQDVVAEQLQKVMIDILGFEKATSRGNRYVLVIVITLRKWAEALPMPDEKTKTVSKLLVEQFVYRYGIPVQLHSDQGHQFETSVFQQMCHLLNICMSQTTPLYLQSDGQTERLNRTLLELLAKLAADDTLEWDNKLPYAMSAFQSTPHTTTGETPNRLMLGKEVTTFLQILTPPPPDGPTRTPWVDSLQANFSDAHQRVLAYFGKEQGVQKNYYDKWQRGLQFLEFDLLWLCVKRMKLAGLYKLNPQHFEGPFEIRKLLSASVYVIE